jgi:type I restriction enzyme, R subunit
MNLPRHSEGAFETTLEAHLLSTDYAQVGRTTFDCERALFPDVVLGFIRETQPKEWAKLEALHGDKTSEQIISDLCKWMDANGSLATLRHGFKCYGRTLRVAFFKAAHELNPELESQYAANHLGITRQLHFSSRTPDKSLDIKRIRSLIKRSTTRLGNTRILAILASRFSNSNGERSYTSRWTLKSFS